MSKYQSLAALLIVSMGVGCAGSSPDGGSSPGDPIAAATPGSSVIGGASSGDNAGASGAASNGRPLGAPGVDSADAGPEGDANAAPGADAGPSSDSGAPSIDSGTSSDAGSPDTGAAPTPPPPPSADAGSPPPPPPPPPPADAGPPPPPPPADAGTPPVAASTNRLVGYYATWTRSTMPASSIPWGQLTHIAHAFVLPSATGDLKSLAGYVDTELLTTAHAHGVKVVASIGGAGASFAFASDPAGRARMIASAVTLCKTYGYDGVDIDWEFPDASTGASWASLIAELRVALDGVDPKLTISAAVAATDYNLKYLPTASLASLDWIGVMTYDFAGEWSGTSGHDAPLYPTIGGDGGSVSQSVDYMVTTRGLPASKVLVGLPFYGHQFAGSSLGSSLVIPSSQVEYRDVVGMVGTSGWSRSWDATALVPFLSRPTSPGFLSYDDAPSIADKCTYAKAKGVGGAIIWHLAADRLGDGSNPLLTAAQGCR